MNKQPQNRNRIISKASQWVKRNAPGFNLEGLTLTHAIVRCIKSNEIRYVSSQVFMII